MSDNYNYDEYKNECDVYNYTMDSLSNMVAALTTVYGEEAVKDCLRYMAEKYGIYDKEDCDVDASYEDESYEQIYEDNYDSSEYDEIDDGESYDDVYSPYHYCSHGIETTVKIEHIIDGLPGKQAAYLFNVLKYFDRAGMKGDATEDLDKARNYAYRLVTGKWENEQ